MDVLIICVSLFVRKFCYEVVGFDLFLMNCLRIFFGFWVCRLVVVLFFGGGVVFYKFVWIGGCGVGWEGLLISGWGYVLGFFNSELGVVSVIF